MITAIAIILIQCLFNYINSYIDAYRIFKNKNIAHGINFCCYAAVVTIELIFVPMIWGLVILFCIQAFLNRQVTFDIPLNLRRRKNDKSITWDYISKAKPPKAITDKIEISIFGYNGRAITLTYIFLWAITTFIYLYIKTL